MPKNGLISNIVSAVREGEIFDVQLVPVSITYEQPVEGVLVEELKGCGKKRESIWTIISGLMTCFGTISRCGDIIVDYGTPVLLSVSLKMDLKFFGTCATFIIILITFSGKNCII